MKYKFIAVVKLTDGTAEAYGFTSKKARTEFLSEIKSLDYYESHITTNSTYKGHQMKTKIAIWIETHTETLKSSFVRFCDDTGTERTEANYNEFAVGMYSQCRH